MENLLISACLIGDNCKYNGGNNKLGDEVLQKLRTRYKIVPVCPEMLGGLPAPRYPCEIKNGEVFNSQGENMTEPFKRGALKALEIAKRDNCCAALLKERSPSCGHKEIYDGGFAHVIISGNGITADLLEINGLAIFGESEIENLLK